METNELESLKRTNAELLLALRRANGQAEEFERRYHLEADKVEALTAKLTNAEVHGPNTSMTDAQAFKWAWAELKKELGGERWKAGEEVESWAFFKYGWDNRTQLELQRYSAPATSRARLSHANVLHTAVTAVYFDDSSDFRTALLSVVRHLDPVLAGELLGSPKSAYDQACARLETARAAVQGLDFHTKADMRHEPDSTH